MSEVEALNANEHDQSKYFKIRKEVVGLFLLAITCWAIYQVHDWWSHLNWPPHDGRNKELFLSTKCDFGKYYLYKKDISSISAIGGDSDALDRKIFFNHPACFSSLYHYSEGTGIRQRYYIFDRETKKQTAIIEITHSRIAQGDLK